VRSPPNEENDVTLRDALAGRTRHENDIDSYVASAWSLLRVRREGRFLSGVGHPTR